MYLMEPAGTKDVASREHDYECNQIEGWLVGEENVRLDSESNTVKQYISWYLREMPYPSIVATALRNRASASASELIMLNVCERICAHVMRPLIRASKEGLPKPAQ